MPPLAITFIVLPVGGLAVAVPVEKKRATIKSIFELVSTGIHTQRDGVEVPCSWYKCTQPQCKLREETIKEVRAGTGLLFRHLQKCNNSLYCSLALESKHSVISMLQPT